MDEVLEFVSPSTRFANKEIMPGSNLQEVEDKISMHEYDTCYRDSIDMV